MSSPSVTRASLLLRIRDPQDRLAWGEFVELYAPLIHGYGMHHGLQDADAADLVQEVLRRVSRSAARFEYDRSRGSFRGWLLTVTRNEVRKMAGRRLRQPLGSGDTQVREVLEQHPETVEADAQWDREYQRNLFLWAAERVKSSFREATWQAFWLTVVEGAEIESVARQLKLSPGAVYIARSRVTARIRQEVLAVEDERGES
jgi:RNA polymerase sigma-70 factor (ECF subfamily)